MGGERVLVEPSSETDRTQPPLTLPSPLALRVGGEERYAPRSNRGRPSSMFTQASFSLTQMCIWGVSASGSSSVASDTPRRAGGSLGAENTGVPHRAQDRRSILGEVGQRVVSPDRSMSSARNTARAK